MTITNGRLLKCDRCGLEEFEKLVYMNRTLPGYANWDKFEENEGWGNIRYGNENIDLCPDCVKEFDRMKKDFVGAFGDFAEE